MTEIGVVLFMLAAVVLSGIAVRAMPLPVPTPLVQIAFGALIAAASNFEVRLDPAVFFQLFLPPLLFLDGWRIPKEGLLRDKGFILELALGLVFLRFPRVILRRTKDYVWPDASCGASWARRHDRAVAALLADAFELFAQQGLPTQPASTRATKGRVRLIETGERLLFEDVAEEAGVANTRLDGRGNDRHSGPTFADMDGDGDLDLFVGGIFGDPNKIYENGVRNMSRSPSRS